MSSDTQASRPISRRAVVGAAVWATPVVAVVTATPAHAEVSPTSDPALSIKAIATSTLWGGGGQSVQGIFTVTLGSTKPGDKRMAVITATARLYRLVDGDWVLVGDAPLTPSSFSVGFNGGSGSFQFANSAPTLVTGDTYKVTVNVVATEVGGPTVLTKPQDFANYKP